MKQNALC